ncbi:MAG TPA: TetR/AcrR family transcriptional regulator [Alphaproteobacteria bacterium]|nr:TetR/AcrR family transcriptional regulator [Alphaproteobacteria bacterium]
MKKKRSEHVTAEKILQAAGQIFMAKGFEGSSINGIADKAKIHKSLIYHHFGSKEGLWKAVKTNLLEAYSGKDLFELAFPTDSFKHFLESFVTLRFEFYDKNPAIARLIMWQRLEDKQEQIKGVKSERLNTIAAQIKEFQNQGKVRPELDPEMVSYMIMKTASLPFMEKPDFFQGTNAQHNKEKFLEMIIEGLYLAFSPNVSRSN